MENARTVLIVDDAFINRALLKKLLSETYNIIEAENGSEAMNILERDSDMISCILLDLDMPVMDGFEVLARLRVNPELSKIPVVVTTGGEDADNEIKALSYGAWDFIKKPFVPQVLRFRIKNAIERSQFSAFEQLKYVAEFDTLTGISNKDKFYEDTRKLISEHPDKRFAIIRLDINHFSLINSFFGMDEGNSLLKYIAKHLRVNTADYIGSAFGRMEADIFGICVPFSDKQSVEHFVMRSMNALQNFSSAYYIVPCFGIYITGEEDIPVSIMFDRATLAAKHCKGNYVNYFEYYNDDMRLRIEKEQEIVNDMNYALQDNQFTIYVQPKYNVMTNTPAGGEVLVRWIHPQKGMIPPGIFIPLFEKNGFVVKLDAYVWEEACKMLKGWIDQGKKPIPISVNVSRVNIYNPHFVENIIKLVDRYRIPHNLFNIELTESAYTDNPEIMEKAISRLQGEGFSIMMDDFGSGYSSLSMLKNIPVDILKIDMNFFVDANKKSRCESIVASIVRMSKWLGIPVIAEGVETGELVSFLREIGCDYIQGYYYAKPMCVKDYERYAFASDDTLDKLLGTGGDTDEVMNHIDEVIGFAHNSQPIAVVECDTLTFEEIEIIRVNDAFFELLNSPTRVLYKYNPLDIVYERDRWKIVDSIKTAIETKGTSECEYSRYVAFSNSYKSIHAVFEYIDTIGNKSILLARLEDITVEREFEKKLKKLRESMHNQAGMSGRMLIIDDSELNRETLTSFFDDKFTVITAENGKQALEMLHENSNIDIILLDLNMPEMNGGEFLKEKNADPLLRGIPVVITTAEDSPRQQQAMLSMNVNDYIVRPFVRETMVRRVDNVLESDRYFRDIINRHSSDAGIINDYTTGIYNRATGEKLINSMLKEAIGMYALLMIDIDHFRKISEECGAQTADRMLFELAQMLIAMFRTNDVVARIGDDEICVLMSNIAGEETVETKCQQIIDKVANLDLKLTESYLSCTIGGAIAEGVNNFDALLEIAEEELEKARKEGASWSLRSLESK